MRCRFDQDLLQEYAIGEVTAAERSQVEGHLERCADCRLEVTDFRHLVRDLAALPEPEFPSDLEEVLIRSAVQAGRALQPPRPVVRPAGIRRVWVYAFSGAAGLLVSIFLIAMLWPFRESAGGPFDRVLGNGVGQGLGLLDSALRWGTGARSTFDAVSDFLNRFAPVGKAVRIAAAGVGTSLWAALLLGAIAVALLLWRITGAGQKKMRSIDHANPPC